MTASDAPKGSDSTAGTGSTESPAELAAELERVRAERDELKAEVGRLATTAPSRHRVRKVTAVVLVVASCVSFLTGGLGIWASRNFLDTDVWLARTGPLIENPAVRSAVTTELTDAAMELVKPEELFKEALPERGQMLAAPLSGAVRGFVEDQVAKVVASDQFEKLWLEANRQAHTAAVKVLRGDSEVVTSGDQTITLNLMPILNQVLARLTSVSPEIFGRTVNIPDVQVNEIPSAAIDKVNQAFGTDLPPDFAQITINDGGTLKEVQDGVRLFDRLVWLSVIVFIAATIGALAASTDRRRTLLQLAITDFVLLVLMRRIASRVETEVVDMVKADEFRGAAKAVTTALMSGLFDGTRALMWLFAAIIVVALVSGPSRWAREVRTKVSTTAVSLFSAARERGSDPATAAWLVAHRDALQIGVAVIAVAVLWWVNLGWIGVLVVLAVAALAIALLMRLPDHTHDDDHDEPEPPTPTDAQTGTVSSAT